MVLGAVDKILGNKWGYGEKFEEGFMAMGALALGIIERSDMQYLARGVLVGITTIPVGAFVGAFVGGVVAGFDISMIVVKLIPVIIVAATIALVPWA